MANTISQLAGRLIPAEKLAVEGKIIGDDPGVYPPIKVLVTGPAQLPPIVSEVADPVTS